MKIQKYGWKPDLPDNRDLHYSAIKPVNIDLPALVDLRPHCPAIYDQGELGSCTANAIAAAFQFDLMKQALPNFTPSRLLIYYMERVIENTVKQDAGAEIRDGIKAISTQGVVDEKLWPYIITKFAKKPSAAIIKKGLTNTAVQYLRLNNANITELKTCLASGNPFVFGFTVYDKFESHEVAQSGFLQLPGKNETPVGGHAVMCVGYDDSKQSFIIRNSWGADWGLTGYFYMPYAYATNVNLADDFWSIRQVN